MTTADINNLKQKLSAYRRGLLSQGKKILDEQGLKMVDYAISNHNYQSDTGNADLSIKRKITGSVEEEFYQLEFYIDPRRVTAHSGGTAWNYVWVQHDGSGRGYKRSKLSPRVIPKLKTKGIQSDHFMVRAWQKYIKEIRKEVRQTQKNLKKELGL